MDFLSKYQWEPWKSFLCFSSGQPQPEPVISPPADSQTEAAKPEESISENQHTEAQEEDSSPEEKSPEQEEPGSDDQPQERKQNYKMAFVKSL